MFKSGVFGFTTVPKYLQYNQKAQRNKKIWELCLLKFRWNLKTSVTNAAILSS